ncbi:MAG: HD domain-containing protein [Actinobacteria bacterium]|nr:HD domain-containing protein [Actinomycetota bacterium]
MSEVSRELPEHYAVALRNYLNEAQEAHLQTAYQLGRQAAESGLGVLYIASVHSDALAKALFDVPDIERGVDVVRVAAGFFSESLAPFEMVHRGFREANARLHDLNQILEMQVAQRTSDLEEALDTLRRVLRETIGAIGLMAERRDPYTAGHQRRVAQLASAIAQKMGWSLKQTDGLRIAALLHDIGKIAVPAEMLSKPGRLTEYEFLIIKTHVQVGFEILNTIEFQSPVAPAVLQHHERLNGSGYPAGLSGEQIIAEARILGVADVIEAMSSHRPYRAALGIEASLKEISQNRSILYSPDVVDACLAIFDEGFQFS